MSSSHTTDGEHPSVGQRAWAGGRTYGRSTSLPTRTPALAATAGLTAGLGENNLAVGGRWHILQCVCLLAEQSSLFTLVDKAFLGEGKGEPSATSPTPLPPLVAPHRIRSEEETRSPWKVTLLSAKHGTHCGYTSAHGVFEDGPRVTFRNRSARGSEQEEEVNVPCRGTLSTSGVAEAPTWKPLLQSRGMLVIWRWVESKGAHCGVCCRCSFWHKDGLLWIDRRGG